VDQASPKIILDPTRPLEQRGQVLGEFLDSGAPMPPDFWEKVLQVQDGPMRLRVLRECHTRHVGIGTDLAERLLFDSSEQVRTATIPLLSFLPSEDRDRVLLKVALTDSSQDSRRAALTEIELQGLVNLAPALMTQLDNRVAEVKDSEATPAQLNEPLRSHLVNLIGTLKALRFSPAISLLSQVAKAQESALAPLWIPAIQALGAIGPQAATELDAIFQYHCGAWTEGDPQIQDAAQACLRQLEAYPTTQRARHFLDICLDAEPGPKDLARQILVSEKWLTSSLPVTVTGLAREGAKQFCKEVIAQWLENEQFQVSVYKRLTSPRLGGQVRREANQLALEFDQVHPVPAGSDAVVGVIKVAVEHLGADEPHKTRAQSTLDRLQSGEDRNRVYQRLVDRVKAQDPLGKAVIEYLMSRASQERDPGLPYLLASKITKLPPRPARKYSELLLSLCRQWYQRTGKTNRLALLGIAESLAKAPAQDTQALGGSILVQFEEVERSEFTAAPQDRTLADHPLLETVLVWLSSGKSRLIKAACQFVQDVSGREHAITCFSCFALVRGIQVAGKDNLSFFIEQIHNHGQVSEEYHEDICAFYQAEDREDMRLTHIQLMEILTIEGFAPNARIGVADRGRGAKERVRLIQYLVKVQDPDAVHVFNGLLGDASKSVNKALIEALGELGDHTSCEPLNELKRKSKPLRGLIDKALHRIFLRYKHLLQSNSDEEISRALNMWKAIGIRVPEAMDDLTSILRTGSPQNREEAAQIYGLEGVGIRQDVALLKDRAALDVGDTLDPVRQACQIAILTITGARDRNFEAQLQNLRGFSSESEWKAISLRYPSLGKRTLQELTDAMGDFWDQQHNPSMAVISLNRACEALTKRLFEMHAVDVWHIDADVVSKTYLGPRSKQLHRLEWMKKHLAADISDFKFIDDLRRKSKSSHANKTKRRITSDELQTATKGFVKALVWSIQASERPPPLLSSLSISSGAG